MLKLNYFILTRRNKFDTFFIFEQRTQVYVPLTTRWRHFPKIVDANFCFFGKNYNFIKNQNLVRDRICGQKLKLWSKIDLLVKTRNFGQQSIFWSKLKMLGKNRYFGQNSKLWAKVKILVKHRNFGQKYNFSVKTRNFGQKSKLWFEILMKIRNVYHHSKV